MSISNNFKVQGDYSKGSELSNIELNENVKTSSIITYNLLELIKNKYDQNFTINVDSIFEETSPVFGVSLDNYIHDLIVDKGLFKYNDENNYQFLYSNSDYEIASTTSIIRCIFNARRKNTDSSYIKNIIKVDDNIITMSKQDNISTIKHKKFFDYDKSIGYNANCAAYDDWTYVPYIKCDGYGHIIEATDNKIYTPHSSSCCRVLLDNKIELTTTMPARIDIYQYLPNKYRITDFTRLAINIIDRNDYLNTYFVDVKDLVQLNGSEYLQLPFANTSYGISIGRYSGGGGYAVFCEGNRRATKNYLLSIIGFVHGNVKEQ